MGTGRARIGYNCLSSKRCATMRETLHLKVTVQPGGKVEIVSPELPVGHTVDVIVTAAPPLGRRSAVDILNEAPGGLLFTSAGEVSAYLKEEKQSWCR